MKKFLSLALALVMTMSLVTISAGATFTDDSTIEYLDAVEVMTALDIVGGYADGSFNPDGTLTRGAAAKIICNLILGPTIASELGTTTDPFPDVAYNHTFAGYIAYCSNQGIINGYEDGTFRPAGTITGYAFMKMLLGALGYDAEVEGYTGTNWAVNVAAKAKTIGLYDGNDDYSGSVALTREEACLYALNTMDAAVVTYDSKSSVTVGDIVISNNSKAETTANVVDSASYDEYGAYVSFRQEYFSDLLKNTGATDEFGRAATEWTYDDDSVGVYASGANLEASYTGSVSKGTLYSLIGSDVYDGLTDVEDADEYDLIVIMDGQDDAVEETDKEISDFFVKSSSSSANFTGNSVYTEVYVDDDNGEVTIIIINTYLVKAADDYDADDEELEIELVTAAYDHIAVDDAISNDDVNVELFEEGDYILVTIGYDEEEGESVIMSVELAETLTGAVTTYTENANVTVDGTKYVYNKAVETKDTEFSIGEDTVLVLDQYGNVIFVDEASTAVDGVVFVEQFGETTDAYGGSTIYAKLYFADGTYVNAVLDEVTDEDGNDYDSGDYVSESIEDAAYTGSVTYGTEEFDAGTWYNYTENDDGTYDLLVVDADDYDEGTLDDDGALLNSTIKFIEDGDTLKGNSSTVFVIKDADGDLYVYTGIANLPTASAVDAYALVDGGYAAYVFINTSATLSGTNTDASDYMLVLDYTDNYTQTEEDERVYQHDVLMDGEEYTVYCYDILTDGAVYTGIEVDEYGYINTYTAFEADNDETFEDALAYATIGRNGDIISFYNAGGAAISDYIFGDDSVVYVYAAAGADDLAYSANDYRLYTYTSYSSLVSKLDDYVLSGTVCTIVTDSGSEEIDAMYISLTSDTVDEDDVAVGSVDNTIFSTDEAADWEDLFETAGATISGTTITVDTDTFTDATGIEALLDATYGYCISLAFEAPEDADTFKWNGGAAGDVEESEDFALVDGTFYLMYWVTIADTEGNLIDTTTYENTVEWFDGEDSLGTETIIASVVIVPSAE